MSNLANTRVQLFVSSMLFIALLASCGDSEQALEPDTTDLQSPDTQEDDSSGYLEALMEERRAREAEAKQHEKELFRRQIEEEREWKAEVARQLATERKAREDMEAAWNEFYVAPEACRGVLSGSISNHCIQLKMDAKKAFLLEYNRKKDSQ